MNKQKDSKSQQEMNTAQKSATSSVAQEQTLNAKQQASKKEYGTLTAKEDANQDYE